jgi:hypothetical protein
MTEMATTACLPSPPDGGSLLLLMLLLLSLLLSLFLFLCCYLLLVFFPSLEGYGFVDGYHGTAAAAAGYCWLWLQVIH